MHEYTYSQLAVGQSYEFSRTVTEDDLRIFEQLSGDTNPLHTDQVYAARTKFGARVVYGMLLSSYLSTLVGVYLPGKYSTIVDSNLQFRKPAFIDDSIVIRGEIIKKQEVGNLITLQIQIAKKDAVLVTGTMHVQVLK